MAQPLFDWQHELSAEELTTIRAVVERYRNGSEGEASDLETIVTAAQAACQHQDGEFLADHQAAIAAAARFYFEE